MPEIEADTNVCTVEVSAWSENSLQKHLTRVQKLLKRRGLAPARVISQERAVLTLEPGEHWATNGGAFTLDRRVNLPYTRALVEVPAAVVRFEGHRCVAHVDATPKGNIFNYVLGEGQEPKVAEVEAFRDLPLRCDHCHTTRARKAAYVFEKEDTGALLMIATNCAKEYFGIDLKRALSDAIGLSNDLKAEGEEWEEILKRRMFYEDYTAASLHAIRHWGYTSQKAADTAFSPGLASSAVASQLWVALSKPEALEDASDEFLALFQSYRQALPALHEEVEAMAAWWEAYDARPGFEANAKVAVTARVCRYANLLSAATSLYLRATWGAYREVSPENNRPVDIDRIPVADHAAGSPGERIELQVTVSRNNLMDGDYGPYRHINFRWEVPGGLAKASHFGTSKAADSLQVGKTYRISAIVKRNDDYKGATTSLLKNLKVLEEIAPQGAEPTSEPA